MNMPVLIVIDMLNDWVQRRTHMLDRGSMAAIAVAAGASRRR
jgi:hypothetical protein